MKLFSLHTFLYFICYTIFWMNGNFHSCNWGFCRRKDGIVLLLLYSSNCSNHFFLLEIVLNKMLWWVEAFLLIQTDKRWTFLGILLKKKFSTIFIIDLISCLRKYLVFYFFHLFHFKPFVKISNRMGNDIVVFYRHFNIIIQ